MHIQKMLAVVAVVATFTACKKDVDPIIVVPPSSGVDRVTFNGGAGGASAANSVYLDLSSDKVDTARRANWDLGFYSSADFRVIINNTTSAGAKVTTKYNLADVGAADTIGLNLSLNFSPNDFSFLDNIAGDMTKTIIPAVSATDAQNPVIILNRGIGGSTPARPWMKLKINRNGSNGYTLQYARITETTFRTLNITKDANYNFIYASLDNGLVSVEPEKAKWDITWTYGVNETPLSAGSTVMIPYNFSDLVLINYLAGVQAAEKVYADANAATAAYNAFNKDSVNRTTFSGNRWTIGSNWRSTQPATGTRFDRFYIIKDPAGNYYKFKSLSMGLGSDGGTRGKPEFRYTYINMQ